MPSALTYPGVYIEEIPSGVRAITGVSTSVTAFVGSAKHGPINKAVRLLSFADFERRFGGLDNNSQMSYAVRQFFLNGGSEAWVVRLAKDAETAVATLQTTEVAPRDALVVTARDAGGAGNQIDLVVTHGLNTFDLLVRYEPSDDPSGVKSEQFTALSMNPDDLRYVEDAINDVSELIQVAVPGALTLPSTARGRSASGDLEDANGDLVDVKTLVDQTHRQFRVSVNGLDAVTVAIDPGADLGGATEADRLDSLCAAIETKVRAQASGEAAIQQFTCACDKKAILMTSGAGGRTSTVRVLRGETQDVAARLKLGSDNGGEELHAARDVRPALVPVHGRLETPNLVTSDLKKVDDTHKTFRLILNEGLPVDVTIDQTAVQGAASLEDKRAALADEIQKKICGRKPNDLAFQDFTCAVDGSHLVLTSGAAGKGSSVRIENAPQNSLSTEVKLTIAAGATQVVGANFLLQNGTESPFGPDDEYNLYIGNRANREGIFALEAVDLFNLLCLPGVSNAGVLADAMGYCQERRAFFIIDPPEEHDKPEEIGAYASGPELPKSDYGAVYYPWIKIGDPLKGGKLRPCSPSGTIAGLFARTDSTRGVWKAAAGTEAVLNGVQGLAYVLTDKENGTLNPHAVNCLRIFPVFGPVAWGARTLRGDDQMASEWKYIPIRRLALFLEESLYRGTKWAVFEPNDEPLWAQIRLNLGAFMQGLFRQGAFQGKTPSEAYFVKCDKETTTQADINLGIVNIVVGFAPLKPAEFVVIKIQQMAGQIQT